MVALNCPSESKQEESPALRNLSSSLFYVSQIRCWCSQDGLFANRCLPSKHLQLTTKANKCGIPAWLLLLFGDQLMHADALEKLPELLELLTGGLDSKHSQAEWP